MSNLCEFLADYTGYGAVDPTCRIDQLVKDSLEFLDLMLELQAHYRRNIPDEVYSELKTVEDIQKVLFAVPS